MKTVCDIGMCNGCMACVNSCQFNAIHVKKAINSYNAIIDGDLCVGCNKCSDVCPRNDTHLPLAHPKKWVEGWAKEREARAKSTSGGVAAAILYAFIRNGGFVCSCSFVDGEFKYILTNEEKLIAGCIGSKYVKSDPNSIFKPLLAKLKKGYKVLFVGLPCHVAAIKSFIDPCYHNRLYTIDLICHGTPSPTILEDFLNDKGVTLSEIENISFRNKMSFRREEYESIDKSGQIDCYSYLFLKKLIFTENCYSCQFATINRISDLTLGDSWGTQLGKDEVSLGISLMLVQTSKGDELINIANLITEKVDLGNAILKNSQLSSPVNLPAQRNQAIEYINKGMKLEKIVYRLDRLFFWKLILKRLISKLIPNKVFFSTYGISVKIKHR